MIDRSISYDDLKGLENILRLKAAGNRTAAKPNKPRPKPTYINGNVIDLHPYLTDEWWNIPTETNTETDDDTSKKKSPGSRLASYDALIDNPMLAAEYWEDRWQNANNKNDFKSSYDYMKWSLAFEDQPFNRGGIVDTYPGRILLNRMRKR